MKLMRLHEKEELQKGIDALTEIFIGEYPYYSTWINKNKHQFESGEKTIFSAKENDEIVGYMMVHFCNDKIAKLNGIYVFEEYKGKGYASEAINQLTKLLGQSDMDLLYVQTRLDNNAVVHLFDKTGFDLIGTNYHEVEEKDNWVACYNLSNNSTINVQKIATQIYDGYKPLNKEEVKQLKEEHKGGNLVLTLKK